MEEGQINRILVVDDSQTATDIMVMFLELEGFEATSASNGNEAIERFQTFQPDLIFMDLSMPEKNGLEAATEIRQLPGGDQVKLVAMTGHESAEVSSKIKKAGFGRTLQKPPSLDDIRELLAAVSAGK